MSDFGKDINVPSNDCISRRAAINIASGYCHHSNIAKELAALPSVHPKFPENWWKTDHGYMWLCPHCGLPVHSDFEECLRCGIKRPSAQRKNGEWEEIEVIADAYDISGVKTWASKMMCDQCGFTTIAIEGRFSQYNYCPNCGADMRGEQE